MGHGMLFPLLLSVHLVIRRAVGDESQALV